MKNIVYLLLSMSLLPSCDKQFVSGVNIDVYIDCAVKDGEGNDLLDPDNPDAYKEEDMKLFYLTNGVEEEYYKPTESHPRHVFIYEDKDEYYLRIFLNYQDDLEEFPITYLQWNDADRDTLQAEFHRRGSSASLTKLWYNGEFVWSGDTNTYQWGKRCEIVK